MPRGKKAIQDRKEVRSIPIQIRVSQYELDEIILCMEILKDKEPISTFIRGLIKSKVKEVSEEVSKA